jgi:hypothetical protein
MQIPLTATPAQSMTVLLGGQQTQISLYTKGDGLFCDVSVNNAPIVQARACHDRLKIVRYGYLGFVGDLCFIDTQGNKSPKYSGLGTRYILVYLAPGES